MTADKPITSVGSFLKIIETSDVPARRNDGLPSRLFRGQPVDKPLLPKFAREAQKHRLADAPDVEERLLDDFSRLALPYLSSARPRHRIEWLAIAQHHGLATRLLDWTGNPLFALWFAVNKAQGPMNLEDFRGTPLGEPGAMVDYLKAYVKDGYLDVPQLINDDYFLAIKQLYNARHFVSAAKLLMSFVDSVAFIDAGDVRDGFSQWLRRYADLSSLDISPKELWEFRNGLLDMTNLRSRAVADGNTAPLIFYVGNPSRPKTSNPSGAKYFSLKGLLDIIAAAVSKWIETYNHNPEKLAAFVERYDLTLSDTRMAYFTLG